MMDIAAVVQAVSRVTRGPCFLHKPLLSGDDEVAVMNIVARGDMVRTDIVRAFEAELAELTERSHCIATNTGTMALRAIGACMGERTVEVGPWGRMPTVTYAATCSALRMLPFDFYDNLAGGPDKQEGRINVSVDLFGLPAPLVGGIHDACESLGSTVRVIPAASRGIAAAISFNASKIVTCGQGGAIVTDDDELAAWCRQYLNQGKGPGHFNHEFIGTNGRMSPMAAALGLSQLRRLDSILDWHRDVHLEYFSNLMVIDGIVVQQAPNHVRWNHWLVPCQVDDPDDRDVLVDALNEIGIEARPCFPCLHNTGPWGVCFYLFPEAEDYSARTLLLPNGRLNR